MRTQTLLISLMLSILVLLQAQAYSETEKKELSEADKARIEQSFGKLPLYFIENQGQVHEDVAYYVKGADKTLYFTQKGVTFALTGKEGEKEKRWVVKLEFVGAHKNVKPKGEDKQKAVFSYFKGKPKDWKTGCPTYRKLVYENLWPGIDLVYSGTVNQLKYEFLVKPGADPKQIRLAYRGASDVLVKETGELMVKTPVGGFEDEKPYAYQEMGSKRIEVPITYTLEKENKTGAIHYGFHLES